MTLFNRFRRRRRAQQQHQGLLFISRHNESDNKMREQTICSADHVESINKLHQSPTISLRQISVPIFSSQSSSDGYEFKISSLKGDQTKHTNHVDRDKEKSVIPNLNYSLNNRGFEPKSNFRFGERTKYPMSIFKSRQETESRRDHLSTNSVGLKLMKDNIVWSQPDPRKTYSIPLDSVEIPKQRNNKLELARKLKIGEYPPRKFLFLASRAQDMKRSSSSENSSPGLVNVVIGQSVAQDNNHSSAAPERDEDLPLWRSFRDTSEGDTEATKNGVSVGGSANRRKSHQQANTVTLIRYLPILMSVPAEQVVVATATPDKSVGVALRAVPAIKTAANSNQASLDESSSASSTTSSPLPLPQAATMATYYRLYRPSLSASKYQQLPVSSSQQEDLTGIRQSYPSVISEFAPTVPPNQSNLGPSSSTIQASNTLLGDFEIPADFAAASSLSAQYPQAGFFIQPAGSSAHEIISYPFGGGGAKLSQLHSGNQQIGQHSSGHSGPSKAISAYASKLISMLRPSSLLASIGPPSTSTAANSAALYPMPPMSQPQIYLLAPAETVLPQHSPHPPSSSQLVKPEDLLLNQATKLHSTTKLSSYSQQQQQPQQQQPQQQQRNQNTDWLHQQQNGLICVHSLVQGGGSKMSAQVTNQEQKQATAEQQQQQQQEHRHRHQQQQHQTTTTNAPILSNQQTTDADQSSFDYIPAPSSTTEYTPSMPKHQSKQSGKRQKGGKQNSILFDKESPVKLAQKLSKKLKTFQAVSYNGFDSNRDSSGVVQEHLSDDFGDKQTEQPPPQEQPQRQHQYQQQQNFLGSSSESRSVIEGDQVGEKKRISGLGNIKSKSKVQLSESAQNSHDNVSSLASKKSIIPFTIKDKIDLPTRRGYHSGNRHSNTSGSSFIQAHLNTNNPVEYDEPSEGEIELQSGAIGKHQRQLQRYSWPAHLLSNNNNQNYQDERRVKTSFISSSGQSLSSLRPPKRKPERENLSLESNNIDYSKENSVSSNGRLAYSLDAGYTLPLLMASSTSLGSSSSSSSSPSSLNVRFKLSNRKQIDDSWQQRGPPRGELGELESENHDRRHEAEGSGEMGQPAFMRPSVVFRAPPPMTTTPTASSTTFLPPTTNPESSTESTTATAAAAEEGEPSITVPSTMNGNELHGLNAAASSSVTTSSTLDGQPVILKSGRLLSHSLDNSNAKLGAMSSTGDSNESPPGFLLVGSSSISGTTMSSNDNNNTASNSVQNKQDEPKKTTANQTVEFLVNSSPHEQETSGQKTVPVSRLAIVRRRYTSGENPHDNSDKELIVDKKGLVNDTQVSSSLKRGLMKGNESDYSDEKNKIRAGLENHSLDDGSSENKAFSNFRLISAESPAEEFAKLSESLQTNPMDLIDLQNSRSSFELPSHLESLSMLFSSSESERHEFPFTSTSNSTTEPLPISTSLPPTTQSKHLSVAPSFRHLHQHEHHNHNENQNQVSLSSNRGWPSSIESAPRNRRASSQSHVRRLR